MDQFKLNHSDTTLPSKAAVVRALLRLEGGATLNEIMNATGWKACSCRSFLTSQRKHRRYKLMRSKIDGVISDIEMPEMDGTALAKWTNEQHGTVQVILVNGLDKPDGQIDNKWSFFRKPIDFAKVCSVIDAAT